MKSRTEILVPFAAIQAVPIAVIAWYRLQRYMIPIQRYRNLVVLLGIYYSLMLHLVQTGTIEDVISQYKTSRIITDKLFTNDEKLSQTIW